MIVDPFTRHDGAYVLGALSPTDRAAFEEHLRRCVRCRRAVSDLAGLPGLLARTDLPRPDAAPDDPPVPEMLLPGLTIAVRRERRRLRMAVVAASLVAAVSLAATALLWADDLWADGLWADGPEQPVAQAPAAGGMLALSPVDESGPGESALDASVGLESVAWGTRVTLTCRYPALKAASYGNEVAAKYVLVVRTSDGGEEPVATWWGVRGEAMTVTGGTAWRADDIVDIEVRTSAGRPLLSLNG